VTGTLVLYAAVAVPYTLFVVLYGTRSPWWRAGIGRSLLLAHAVTALLAWNAVLALGWPDYPGRGAVRVLIVCGALVAGWTQLALLVIEQRRARRCKESERA
jgi:hypothetical protein